jgi:hypothetical protein
MDGTMNKHGFTVAVDDQVFVGALVEEVGAVRSVTRDHLFVYIENAGEFQIDAASVLSAHDGKVILDPTKLEPALAAAVSKAHARETE